MRTARLRRRRSLAQRALLSVVAVLVFAIGGVGSGLVTYLTAATDAGVRTALADAASREAAYQITARAGDDATAQDAAVTEALGRLLPDIPYDLYRSMATGPRSVYRGGQGLPRDDANGEDDADSQDDSADDVDSDDADEVGHPDSAAITRGVLAAYQDLPDHAELVTGRWPQQSVRTDHVPVALHASSAAALGLGIGDVISISDRGEVIALSVTGTWRPVDAEDRFWYGEPLEVDGTDARHGLFAVAAAADLAAIPGTAVTARWRLVPQIDRLTAADVAVMRSALPRVRAHLEADSRLDAARVSVDDELLALLRHSDDRIQAARSVAAAPLIVLGMAGVLALGLVGRLLALLREPETAVLRARGASAGRLSRWAFREALLVAGVPALLGGLGAWMVLRLLPDIGPSVSVAILVISAGATGAAAVATLTVVGYRAAVAAGEPTGGSPAVGGRRGSALRAGAGVLIVGIATFSLWRLHRAGTPAAVDASGIARIDPVAAFAPAAALLAGGVLGALAVGGVAWVGQRLVQRRSGLTGSLAVRQIARRPATYAVPVVLVVLATGTGTLSAGFAATWSSLQEQVAAQRTGADLQVVLRGAGRSVGESTPALRLETYRAVAGVQTVTPVVSLPRVALADGSVELIATPRGSDLLADAVVLPAGTRALEFDLRRSATAQLDEVGAANAGIDSDEHDDPPAGEARISLWLTDADGTTSYVRADQVAVPVDQEPDESAVQVDLPRGAEPWRLVGIDIQLTGGGSDLVASLWAYDVRAELTALRSQPSGRAVNLRGAGGWTIVPPDNADRLGPDASLASLASGIGLRVDSGGTAWSGSVTERLIPGADATAAGATGPVAVTATAAAMDRYGLAVGDELSLRALGQDLPVRIAASVDAVPGTTALLVMVADLEDLTAAALGTGGRAPLVNQIWVELDAGLPVDGPTAAAVARRAGPDSLVLDRAAIEADLRGEVFIGLSVVTSWVASGAAVLLAATGLAAGTAVLARQRATELAILRSVGLSAAQQARSRRREQILITTLAVTLGVAVGWLVTVFTARPLAATATPSPLEVLRPVLHIALVPWTAFVGTALAAGVLLAVVHGAQVRRQVADGLLPEVR